MKKNTDTYFSRKWNVTISFLEHLSELTHSDGSGEEGKEYPEHLRDIMRCFLKLSDGGDSKTTKKGNVSERNLKVQSGIVSVLEPAGTADGTAHRQSTRAGNSNIVEIVSRCIGNVHDAGATHKNDSGAKKGDGNHLSSSNDKDTDVHIGCQ